MFLNKKQIKYNDFQTMCRTCIYGSDLIPIQDNFIIEAFQNILDISFKEDDELPQNICSTCINKINEIQSFVLQSKEIDLSLKKTLTNFKNEISIIPAAEETINDHLVQPIIIKEEIVIDDDDDDYDDPNLLNSETIDKDFEDKIEFLSKEESDFKEDNINTPVLAAMQFVKIEHLDCEKKYLIKDTSTTNVDSAASDEEKNTLKATPSTRKLKRTCDICNKTFTQSSGLTKHKRIHTSERCFRCEICNKGFTDPSNLRRHKRTHSNLQPYECHVCNKKFKEPSNLKVHQLRHEGIKPFKCELCDKVFTQLGHLLNHKRTHSGERLFWCYLCRKNFTQSSDLTEHLSTHSDLKPFKCEICNKEFNQSSNLLKHKMIHTEIRPYECKTCNKNFTQSSSLARHLIIHSGARPFQCDLCPKAFNVASNLRQHRATHSGARLFKCKLCDKSFSRSSALKKHENKRHNDSS